MEGLCILIFSGDYIVLLIVPTYIDKLNGVRWSSRRACFKLIHVHPTVTLSKRRAHVQRNLMLITSLVIRWTSSSLAVW